MLISSVPTPDASLAARAAGFGPPPSAAIIIGSIRLASLFLGLLTRGDTGHAPGPMMAIAPLLKPVEVQ